MRPPPFHSDQTASSHGRRAPRNRLAGLGNDGLHRSPRLANDHALIYQPELAPGFGDVFGLGDIQQSLFLSPARPGKGIWGVGPIFQFPSATDDARGQGKWGAGPTAVALRMHGPRVFGALINNVWSFARGSDWRDVNQMLIQPFINYNLPDVWYVGSSPIITANWEADSDNQWTVPLGVGEGKIVRLGKLPVNTQVGGTTTWYARTTPPSGSCASRSSSCFRGEAR